MNANPQVQVATRHAKNNGAQTHATVNNGQTPLKTPVQMRVLRFAWQSAHDNPSANAYTEMHTNGQISQNSKMPTPKANLSAPTYSILNAYQHGGT